MSERMIPCSNCRVPIAESKYDLHEGFCIRNNIQCKRCGQFYDKNDPESHEEEFHSKQQCPHCKQDFQDLAKHYCSKKPKSCLHCGLDFANDAILQHENVCGSRTEKCQVCKKHIQLRDLRKHEQTCTIEKEFPQMQDKPQRNEIYDKPYYENKQERQLLEKKYQAPQQQIQPRSYTPKQEVPQQKPTFIQRNEPQRQAQNEAKRPDSKQFGRREELPKPKPLVEYKQTQSTRQPPTIISNSTQVVDNRNKNPIVQQPQNQYTRVNNQIQDQQGTRFPIQEPKTNFDSNYDKDQYKVNKIVQPSNSNLSQQQQQQQQYQYQNKYSQQVNPADRNNYPPNQYQKQGSQPLPDRNQKDNYMNNQQQKNVREQIKPVAPQSVYVPKTYGETQQKLVRPDTAIARELQEQMNFEDLGMTEQDIEDQKRYYESMEQKKAEQRQQAAPKRVYEEKKVQPIDDLNFEDLGISEEEKRMQEQILESMQQQKKPQGNKPSYPFGRKY